MPNLDDGSVTHWINGLKSGDGEAARLLWNRYFERLVRLAYIRLRASRGGAADEEDAALSAFDSLCRGAAAGRFPRLTDRDDLWRLLVVLTARKAIGQAKRMRALKRGEGRVLGEAELAAPEGGDGRAIGLDQLVGEGPTPEFAAMVAEEYKLLLAALRDDALRQVAVWKLEGYTNEQIRERLGCSLRTVANKLELIRKTWQRLEGWAP